MWLRTSEIHQTRVNNWRQVVQIAITHTPTEWDFTPFLCYLHIVGKRFPKEDKKQLGFVSIIHTCKLYRTRIKWSCDRESDISMCLSHNYRHILWTQSYQFKLRLLQTRPFQFSSLKYADVYYKYHIPKYRPKIWLPFWVILRLINL